MNGRESVGKAVRIPEIKFDFRPWALLKAQSVLGPLRNEIAFDFGRHRKGNRQDLL
jgi:hypothetical protein